MSGNPRHVVHRNGQEVAALYDLPWHGQVCLHTEDAELVNLLEAEGLLRPRRPPYLDAAPTGVHGAYRPTPQINFFFEPPLVLGGSGYTLRDTAPSRP